MLEHLFGSKTRLKLLKIFYRDPTRSYYVRELTRLIEGQINAVRRELELLLKAGLVKEIERGTDDQTDPALGFGLRKYYVIDTGSVLYAELHALLVKANVLGEQKFVEEVKKKAGEFELFILTGRFTGDHRAPSDMLLVGKLKERSIARVVQKYEQELGCGINYTTMTSQEFQDRRQVMDKFLFSLFEANHVKIIDKLNV